MNPGLIEFLFAFAVGLCATLVMTLIEIPLWKRFGLRGVLEWHENQILSARFFRLSNDTMHFKGIFLLHFLNGGLGGVGFLLVWWLLPVIATSVIPAGIAGRTIVSAYIAISPRQLSMPSIPHDDRLISSDVIS